MALPGGGYVPSPHEGPEGGAHLLLSRIPTMTYSPDMLSPLHTEFWMRIAAAAFCGWLLGLERQLRGKPAGMRTSILICMGTQFFVALGASFGTPNVDPTRVLGQVVAGIGFLGAGVILTREGLVIGVTSAAVIWMLAAMGAMIGLGYIVSAVVAAVVTLVILVGIEKLEVTYRALRRGVHGLRTALNPSGEE